MSSNGTAAFPALYEEHALLGARFGDAREVLAYADNEAESAREVGGNGATLCDVSFVRMTLLSGEASIRFVHAAFAGYELSMGECSFEAILTGDGCIASIPLVVRTGTCEYVVIDGSPRADVLDGWMSFLWAVEQDGTAPFAGMTREDVSQTHVALVLSGVGAKAVLGDYTDVMNLPAPGRVRSCDLDRIPCIVVGVPGTEDLTYLVLAPPSLATVLWRSLLSFSEVLPIGVEALGDGFLRCFPWITSLCEDGRVRISAQELERNGLMRESRDFVGARGLSNEGEGGTT
jgi:aminomethyltransferase